MVQRRRWRMDEAKERFNELVDKALTEGPQVISRRGREVAVVVSKQEFARLRKWHPSLLEFFRGSPLGRSGAQS